ncbi:MAG: hypothetical protein KME17_15005 [Cyanosarcina radialis HA8281-LM2]|jgi:hypothetical protein|nr:hypothetical protein [Cyanosarcina radialis HA8281-LM2]
MTNSVDLLELTNQQLVEIVWILKGTPQARICYRELSRRPASLTLSPDDPLWEEKLREQICRSQNDIDLRSPTRSL